MTTEIRGVRYDGNFRIPQGGVAYPSRPGGSSLSKFPTLSGDDSTIRQQFSAWDRIVQASMKAQNLSQLYDHAEYDDAEHKDSFNPFFMSTNNATAASIAQKMHYFDTKKQEAYLNLLMCIDTRGSATGTLNTLVEMKSTKASHYLRSQVTSRFFKYLDPGMDPNKQAGAFSCSWQR